MDAQTPILTTIGYEGASLADFLETLRAAKVRRLIDVRELPISRRKGFAKNALSTALAGAGIEYVHLKGLGDPKDGRDAARRKDYEKFTRLFTAHMETEVAQSDLALFFNTHETRKAAAISSAALVFLVPAFAGTNGKC